MKISKRLQSIVDLINPTTTVADIGTDHGLLAIAAILQEKAKYVIAIDNKIGPLNRCKANIEKYELFTQIQPVLSDGLSDINSDIDCIVIAGVGKDVISELMMQSLLKFKKASQILIDSHSKHFELKEFLFENGFKINQEKLIYDQNKYYILLDVVYNQKTSFDLKDVYLLKNQTDIQLYVEWLKNQIDQFNLINQFSKHSFSEVIELFNQELLKYQSEV